MPDDLSLATFIDDAARLDRPADQLPLVLRIQELSSQRCTTAWMLTETAAISLLLAEGGITAGRVWELVRARYNIASCVSSTLDPEDDPDWLARPLADRALVWSHLGALCAGLEVPPVPALPGPYDDQDTPEATALIAQTVDFLAGGLNLLAKQDQVDGGRLLEHFEHELRHGVEHQLAVRWFGGMCAIGASLHGLPLPGGSFGLKDQPVYVLKALVEVLKRDIAEYETASCNEQDDPRVGQELLGRIELWWSFVKGYTCDMVDTHQGTIVVAMLVDHPALVEDLKAVLMRGLELMNSGTRIPEWSGRIDCDTDRRVAEMPTDTLIGKLDTRLHFEKAQASAARL